MPSFIYVTMALDLVPAWPILCILATTCEAPSRPKSPSRDHSFPFWLLSLFLSHSLSLPAVTLACLRNDVSLQKKMAALEKAEGEGGFELLLYHLLQNPPGFPPYSHPILITRGLLYIPYCLVRCCVLRICAVSGVWAGYMFENTSRCDC